MFRTVRKVWIIAGEPSGDNYGAALASALRELEPNLIVEGMGGSKMREAGVNLFVDSTELAIIGVIEAIKKLFFFIGLLRKLTEKARLEKPDAVVLIDYPGFNIRLAARLKKLGIPVVYYVSPQVWAWKEGRVYKLAKYVRRMLCIFPFEPQYYAKTALKAIFVGHPLLELLQPYKKQQIQRDNNLVLLLPGSRRNELDTLLAQFLKTAERMKQENRLLHFAMPLTDEGKLSQAKRIIAETGISPELESSLELSIGNTRELMCKAAAGLAASGTVTVEATILGLPVVVAYRINSFTFWLAKKIIKLPSITIANLVTHKQVFEEFLQDDVDAGKMLPALKAIMPDGARRQEVMSGIEECVQALGAQTAVSETVARNVLEVMQE